MGVPCDLSINPNDVHDGHNEQDRISEQTHGREGVNSTDLLEKDNLKQLTDEEHQVEIAEDFDQDESVVDGVHTFLIIVF